MDEDNRKRPQTRGQKRAKEAYKCVNLVAVKKDDYLQIAKKFPALVQACGLAQALAFVEAKEGATGTSYVEHLARVVGWVDKKGKAIGDLGKEARASDLMRYQRLTIEAIESATWLKRYSEALMED